MADPTCKTCGGSVVVVLGRAWCLKRYSDGGCGGNFTRDSTSGKWRNVALSAAGKLPK